jgi:hypothetical protein
MAAIQMPAFTGAPIAERRTPTALIASLAALLVVAFAGVAVAVIIAVSNSDQLPQPSAAGARTTITVISHGP